MDKLKPQTTIWFVAAWFGAALTTLIFSVFLSLYLSEVKVVTITNQNFKLYAALPQSTLSVSDNVNQLDARPKIVENFFKDYKSELANLANVFINVADKYQLDWRLLPSIAMQESNGGQKVIVNSYNPFGYGIYGNSVIRFPNWQTAIERVGKALRDDYLNKGLITPEQIMAKYTPPSLLKDGAWAKGVSSFIGELR